MENLEISNLWSSSTTTNTFDLDISTYVYDVLYRSQMISSINKRLNDHCLICFWFMSSNTSIIRIKPIVLTKVYAEIIVIHMCVSVDQINEAHEKDSNI